jgi:hypothetical protein
MDFTDYMIWKAVALCALAFLGNFFYSFFTGKSITQVRRDKQQAQEDQQEH